MTIRHNYLDILRVSAVIGVIMLHSSAGILFNSSVFFTGIWYQSVMFDAAFRWCVPIFIMISGILLVEKYGNSFDLFLFFKQRLVKIIIPTVFWSIVYVLWKNRQNTNVNYFDEFNSTLFQPAYYHLWFMYMIFGIYLLMPVLSRMIKNESSSNVLLYFLVLWFIFGSCKWAIEVFTGQLFKIDAEYLSGGLPYIFLGVFLNRIKLTEKIFKVSMLILVSSYFLTIVLVLFVAHRNREISNFFLDFRAPNIILFSSSFFLTIKIASERYKIFKNNQFKSIVNFISSLSFGIYFSHVIVLEFLTNGYISFLNFNTMNSYFYTLSIAFLTFGGATFLCYLLSKFYTKHLFL